MGVSVFLCLPRVRSVAPSHVFLRARLEYLASLCHVFCVFAYVSGLLSLPGGSVPATACTRMQSFQSVFAVKSFGGVRAGSKHSSFRNHVYLDNWLGLG